MVVVFFFLVSLPFLVAELSLYDVDVPCASEVYLPDSFREVMSSMIVSIRP